MKFLLFLLLIQTPLTSNDLRKIRFIKDPTVHEQKNLNASESYIMWAIDMNHDQKNEIFITSKEDIEECEKNHDIPGWSFYIPESQGEKYTHTFDLDSPQIDPAHCYVGYISEIKKYGILSCYVFWPRNGQAILSIFAYTLEGEYLRETYLFKGSAYQDEDDKRYLQNPIYLKYLSEEKRTKIKLQSFPKSPLTPANP